MEYAFFLQLILMLVVARLFGEALERFGQSAVVGEIAGGVLLCMLFPAFMDPNAPGLSVIVDLAIFFLIFNAGLELSTKDMKDALTGGGIFVGICGFLVAFTLGAIVSSFFVHTLIKSLFIGLCLAITALPVGVRILQDLGKLNTRLGKAIVTSALFDDVLSVAGMVILLALNSGGTAEAEMAAVIRIIISVLVLVGAVIVIEYILTMKYGLVSIYTTHYIRKFRSKEASFTIPLAFVLAFSILAAFLGLHFIIGAFYGALVVTRSWIGDTVFKGVKQVSSAITFGFMAPIFLAYIGLWFKDGIAAFANYWFLLSLILIAIIGKVAGGFIGAKMSNFSNNESLLIGFGLSPRGIVEIVIALIGLKAGIINQGEFSILVMVSIISTMLAPVVLKKLFKKVEDVHEKTDFAIEGNF